MTSGIEFNEDVLREIQENANAAGQQVIRDVNGSHKGRPVDEVEVELLRRYLDIGVEPNRPVVREFAESIADGTLIE